MDTIGYKIERYLRYLPLLFLLIACFISMPCILSAGQIGENIPISNVAYNQQNPHTIFVEDPSNPDNGLWFVVWEDWRDPSTGADIYGRFYDKDGNACGDEFVISDKPGNQTVPRAAYRKTGSKIVVVWQDTRPNYVKFKRISVTDFSTCAHSDGGERDIGFNSIEEFDDRTTAVNNYDDIGIGDGSRYIFESFLKKIPIVPGTVEIYSTNWGPMLIDDGSGNLSGWAGTGSIDYSTGHLKITLTIAPISWDIIYARYHYYEDFTTRPIDDDSLISRQAPKITYNMANDEFLIVWKETRSILHRVSEICFVDTVGYITGWEFGDSDFIGYVRINGGDLSEKQSLIGVNGADIIRNSKTITNRRLSKTSEPWKDTWVYEYFESVNNPDVLCDNTSTQCLIVFEGIKKKATLTCNCKDRNSNDYCDPKDDVTDTLDLSCFNTDCSDSQCFTHVFGIFDDQIPKSIIESKKIDTAKFSFYPGLYYPSIGFDYVSKKYLVSWEDMRSDIVRQTCISNDMVDLNTKKVWGRLVYSGGDLYGLDFMISYQDLNNDGNLDDNVKYSKQTRPFVSYDPVNQRFFVLWQDGRNSLYSMENIDIYGQKVDSEGSLRGNNFPVFTYSFNQESPVAAYNPSSNNFLVVWKDARNAEKSDCGSSNDKPCGSDIYGQRFTLGNPALTLLNMDNTPLMPPLITKFENPAGSGGVAVGLSDIKSFKIMNTGDIVLNVDYIDEDLDCNPGTPGSRTIEPFSIDLLPLELQARGDGSTLDLVPGAQAVLTVRFSPTDGVSYNRCFVIESNGGIQRVNLSGVAKEPDIVLSLPGNPFDFGSVNVGFYRDVSFVISNNGTSQLSISSVEGTTFPFSIRTDGCSGANLQPGNSCNIVIRMAPTSTGSFSSTFSVNSNDPDTPSLAININGTGVGIQDITVSPLTINFGYLSVGQTLQRDINIRNDGSANLTINSIVGPVAPFSITSNTCPATLTSGSSCKLTIQFAPTFQGVFSSVVSVQSNDPDESVVDVNISGTSVIMPDIDVNPSSVVFPDTLVNTTNTQTITVTNNGSGNLSISGITNPGGDFRIVGSNCIRTLAPSGTCTITVAFSPTSAGFKQATFQINSNDPDVPSYTVYLSGRGYTEPDISVSPPQLSFGTLAVGQTATLSLTVTNTGSADLIISGVSSPALPFSITSNTCAYTTLEPSEACQLSIRFAPTAAGTYNSSISINSNDPGTPTVTVNLTGTSTLTNYDVNPLSIDFGSVNVGSRSTERTVTVTNTGVRDLVITSVKYPGSPFIIIRDTCKNKTLVTNETCSIGIVFNPTRVAYYSNYYLTINTNDTERPKVRVSLTGRGVSP